MVRREGKGQSQVQAIDQVLLLQVLQVRYVVTPTGEVAPDRGVSRWRTSLCLSSFFLIRQAGTGSPLMASLNLNVLSKSSVSKRSPILRWSE